MNKIWQVYPRAREEFFKKYPEHDRVVMQLLYNRGVRESDDVEFFLSGRYEHNFDPFIFRRMEEAVLLVIGKIKQGKKICVYGDYDADGVTSAALLHEVLTTLRAECFVYIPDRSSEGYGMHKEAIDKIAHKGAELIITVDNGIRNKAEVAYAKEKGMEVLVTDHHEPPENEDDLPQCLIIDPHVRNERYPFKYLAGVAVAFKFARALVERSTLTGEQKERILTKTLDLVAIGTVADCVTLLGENRLLLKKGLDVLNSTKRVGLKELIKKSKIEGRQLESWNIGFQIAPRLNASGRMGSAGSAFNLLSTHDKEVAEVEAGRLDERNQRRQKETEEIVLEVEEQIKKQLDERIIIGVCPEGKKHWNEGIVGLVAGRITEKYYKPCLIITRVENSFKGSGRSIDEFNLFKALEESRGLLLKHGGHPLACGFSLSFSNIAAFSSKMREIARRDLANASLESKIKIDCELEMSSLNRTLVKEIDKLAPFGFRNPQPRFVTKGVQIRDIVRLGQEGKHVKFRFDGLWGIGFGRAEEWKELKIGDLVDVAYSLEINEFNGNSSLQLKLADVRLSHV
jgi:single-stranded-DNA-specific exonuclease